MNRICFERILIGALCGLLAINAAARPRQRAVADLGAPGEGHKKLDVLAGVWEVTLNIPVAPGRHVEGKASCEANWAMDGRFMRLEYSSNFGGKPLTVVRYLGFDRHKGKFVEAHFESTHTALRVVH
jgi:hypothetical protein